MSRISDILAAGPSYSLEFGPPRSPEQEERLAKTLLELEPLGPSFVSVTYGAGGSTRDVTARVVGHIHTDTSMTVMPHLTCVAHTRPELTALAADHGAQLGDFLVELGHLLGQRLVAGSDRLVAAVSQRRQTERAGHQPPACERSRANSAQEREHR